METIQNKKVKKILFFTPYAGRTGSEMFLWYMFKHFNRNVLNVALVSECKGELLPFMPSDVPTFVTLKYPTQVQRIKGLLYRKMGHNLYESQLKKIHNKYKPD